MVQTESLGEKVGLKPKASLKGAPTKKRKGAPFNPLLKKNFGALTSTVFPKNLDVAGQGKKEMLRNDK